MVSEKVSFHFFFITVSEFFLLHFYCESMGALVAENLYRIYLQEGWMDRSFYEAATICCPLWELKNMGPINFYEYEKYRISESQYS